MNPDRMALVSETLRNHPRAGSATPGQVIAHALTSEGHDASEDGTGRGTPIIASPLSHGSNPNSNVAGRRREDNINLIAGTLGGGNHGTGRRSKDDPNLVAYALRRDPGGTGQGHNTTYATQGATVRRLTPTECERLQALPDGWTAFGPDSKRYAALGDAVTASVAEWIGRRLAQHITARSAA